MTSLATVPSVTLNNDVTMPALGFGLFTIPDEDMGSTVSHALSAGYRAFDTAPMYRNEASLGAALARADVDRDEIFVTTKISNEDQGYQRTLDAFEASAAKLGRIDLCLIHWPAPSRGQYLETWRALEKLYYDGRVRAIGVSNFQSEQLERLAEIATITPAVNQIELHPLLTQSALTDLHRSMGVRTQAWAPLARGHLNDHALLAALAARHRVSVAQIVLRWHLQIGTIPLPKSFAVHRIRQNVNVFGFRLSAAEMDAISALNRDQRTGPHPDDVD
ncbi:aldo/keto reductase [Rhodococcus opacus]|uniref:aldo/keto reductase n=1 Tax=Rhodococcus opacus TaxID=37919 RepID=UPI002476BAF8|nr:aldo/keto reductase [Rhodococcus opacus]MDH6287449.1 2,5-diketo-D-gluconate reductase A [Rhodococcus opacus]